MSVCIRGRTPLRSMLIMMVLLLASTAAWASTGHPHSDETRPQLYQGDSLRGPFAGDSSQSASAEASGLSASSNLASAVLPRPETGTFVSPLSQKGYGEMLITNGLEDDAVVVLTGYGGSLLFAVYLRSDDQFTVEGIADGAYRMFFTTGTDWDYAKMQFGRIPEYYLMQGVMPFATKVVGGQTSYTIYEVTLHEVPDGNVERQSVKREDFPLLV